VHGLVAAVAEHLAVRIVRALANKAWLPDFHGEELVLHDHGWVNLSLLHLVLDGIAVNDGATDCLAELDGVEFGATYGTAVRALDPRLEACVVQVVSAGQKMGYNFVVVVDTRCEMIVSMVVKSRLRGLAASSDSVTCHPCRIEGKPHLPTYPANVFKPSKSGSRSVAGVGATAGLQRVWKINRITCDKALDT
jgi:hypothetical protein